MGVRSEDHEKGYLYKQIYIYIYLRQLAGELLAKEDCHLDIETNY